MAGSIESKSVALRTFGANVYGKTVVTVVDLTQDIGSILRNAPPSFEESWHGRPSTFGAEVVRNTFKAVLEPTDTDPFVNLITVHAFCASPVLAGHAVR